MKKTLIAIAILFALISNAPAQTFGGVQTNFITIYGPTNSVPVWTNIDYYGLPNKLLVVTNLWAGQSNFIASWVYVVPARTNVFSLLVSFVGVTNTTWSTNISFYGPMTNVFFMSASPGTNAAGVFYTNGVFVQ